MGKAWASLLARLRRAYAGAGLNCGDRLLPPAADEAVERRARWLGVRFPATLRAVWRTYGGQRYVSPGVTGLFGMHRLHTPAELAGNYRMFRAHPDSPPAFPPAYGRVEYFHPRLFPFASWDIYNLCLDAQTGAVWQYSPNYGVTGGTSRPSLRALVRELLALLAAGRPPEPDFIYPRPVINPRWRTADVLGLARGIAADGDLSPLPILADALMEAGCDDNRLLGPCQYARRKDPGGWWVIDLLLAGG